MRPMISVAATTGLLEAITAAGGSPGQILHTLGLDRAVLSNSEGFIASSIVARILEDAARATGDACFGLHFGEHYNPKNLGPLIYVVLNSSTIAVGLTNAERYLMIHNGAARMFLAVENERAYIRHRLVDLEIEVPRQHNEYSMAVALNTFRMMAGSQWAPQEVQFAHEAPPRTSEHLRVFGAPVLFGCETNAFVVDREFLERQVSAADQRLYGILKQYLDRVLNEMPREDEMLAAIRKAIAESMRNGIPRLDQVAKKVAMSPRTLERRMKEYGIGFKKLLEDTRRRFALNYLKDRKHTLTDIAYLLGYSELSAFNRAFKRWTGRTPMHYRRNTAK